MESNTQTTYTTETTKTVSDQAARNAALNALAIVGFIALVCLGITLAIYSARYVPLAVNKLESASALLSTSTLSNSPAALTVVSSTTIPFQPTLAVSTTTSASTNEAAVVTAPVVATHAHTLYGYSDLATTIESVGYLADGTSASFIPAQVIPIGARAAIKFSIANDGTNATGQWIFVATIPTHNGYVFSSPVEENLNPGDHIEFTLGFDQADLGPNEPITIIADPANLIPESNEGNNSASAVITVVGS